MFSKFSDRRWTLLEDFKSDDMPFKQTQNININSKLSDSYIVKIYWKPWQSILKDPWGFINFILTYSMKFDNLIDIEINGVKFSPLLYYECQDHIKGSEELLKLYDTFKQENYPDGVEYLHFRQFIFFMVSNKKNKNKKQKIIIIKIKIIKINRVYQCITIIKKIIIIKIKNKKHFLFIFVLDLVIHYFVQYQKIIVNIWNN